MQLAPGMLVTPNVRLLRMLGEGGMGSVWAAEHTTLRTQVAVKFIASEGLGQPEVLARFSREAAAAAQIKSPYVVQTFDHGVTADGLPYIVMEMLEGEDLGARIFRLGRLDLPTTAEIVRQVGKALARAHKLGIVHRDIKPDNIYLTDTDGELACKVLDFGIAKQTGLPAARQVTSTGVMVGTPGYMSPEQVLSGKDLDARSDLWSLGVVAYHALTGEPPFDGETLGAIAVAISQASYEPATARRPDLPPEVDTFMRRALAVRLADRFATAKELTDAFDAIPGARVGGVGPGAARASAPSGADASGARAATHPPEGSTQLTPATHAVPAASMAAFAQTTLGGYEPPRQRGRGRLWLALGVLGAGAMAAVAWLATRGGADGAGAEPGASGPGGATAASAHPAAAAVATATASVAAVEPKESASAPSVASASASGPVPPTTRATATVGVAGAGTPGKRTATDTGAPPPTATATKTKDRGF
ncbi:MAG: protein kinase [Polyangiaceae bacterium]|nr:protein kinase [Polyangiaceae bacterium]